MAFRSRRYQSWEGFLQGNGRNTTAERAWRAGIKNPGPKAGVCEVARRLGRKQAWKVTPGLHHLVKPNQGLVRWKVGALIVSCSNSVLEPDESRKGKLMQRMAVKSSMNGVLSGVSRGLSA